MGRGRFDWVGLAERAYDVTLNDQDWLESIAACVRPVLDDGNGLMGGIAERVGNRFVPHVEFVMGAPRVQLAVSHMAWKMAPQATVKFFSTQGRINSSDLYPGAPALLAELARRAGFALSDTSCFVAPDGQGVAVGIAGPRASRAESIAPQEKRSWATAAGHVGAALRLRRKLMSVSLSDPTVEAIYDEGGRAQHVTSPVIASGLLEQLSEVIRTKRTLSERAETRESDEALELWPALFSGRWSLVDRRDRDGKRFVVAYRNDVEGGDPRGLSYRERQVAELAAQEEREAGIAEQLGLSESTVRSHLASFLRKLGFSSRAEFQAFAKVRPETAQFNLDSVELLVGELPAPCLAKFGDLSHREREVVGAVLAGKNARTIASTAGLSPRTVETQLSSAYRKLGVTDRVGLFRLASRHEEEKN